CAPESPATAARESRSAARSPSSPPWPDLSAANGGSGSERSRRVDAEGVPQEEALSAVRPRGRDLLLDVQQCVGPAERKVLQPGREASLTALERAPEVRQRARDDLAGLIVRRGEPVLARVVV